jgi:transposase, IS30 family
MDKERNTHLSLWERQVIYRMYKVGLSFREIGVCISRDASVVCREVKRNRFNNPLWLSMTVYEQARYADERARRRRSESRRGERTPLRLVALRGWLFNEIERTRASPEALAGELKRFSPEQGVSGKTIRRWIHRHAPELKGYYREGGRKRRRRIVTQRKKRRQAAPLKVRIDERPANVDDHKEVGHFELDLITCCQSKETILSLRELATRTVFLKKTRNKKAETINGVLRACFAELPTGFVQSITTDNGGEFAEVEKLRASYGFSLYFCYPYRSWEKGSVENANRLVREYIPKKTDLSQITNFQLREIAERINNRPMQCLGFRRPLALFQEKTKAFGETGTHQYCIAS